MSVDFFVGCLQCAALWRIVLFVGGAQSPGHEEDAMPNNATIVTAPRLAALVTGLEAAGWRILDLDLNLSRETARIELRRADGLNITFDARSGVASLTREVIETETVRVGRRGDYFRAERLRPRFIGRDSGMGLRQGLRALCNYLSDNATAALPAGGVRNLFRPLMDGSSHALPSETP